MEFILPLKRSNTFEKQGILKNDLNKNYLIDISMKCRWIYFLVDNKNGAQGRNRNLKQHLKKEFSTLLSYNQFVELMPSILIPMCAFIQAQSKTHIGI